MGAMVENGVIRLLDSWEPGLALEKFHGPKERPIGQSCPSAARPARGRGEGGRELYPVHADHQGYHWNTPLD